MKPINVIRLAIFGLTTGTLAADPPQTEVSFTSGSGNTWNADWNGETQRTFFVRWSLDLQTWHFAPVVEFGSGAKNYGIDTGGATKFFLGLKYIDAPWITTLQEARDADFDSDGIPSAYEVEELGSDPFSRGSAGGDSDSDGLADGWELYYFGELGIANPTVVLQPDGLTNKEKSDLGLDPDVDYSAPTASEPANYTYDLTGRLTGVSAPVGAATFTPDEEGNILSAQ